MDRTSRTFTMILLILLILFGTVTMINLFIAAIMSDLEKLKSDVTMQNLIFTAQCSILVEELLPRVLLKNIKLNERNVFCIHEICPTECSKEKFPEEIKHLSKDLKQLIDKKIQEYSKVFTN